MVNTKYKYENKVSEKEIARRKALVLGEMKKKEIDCVIVHVHDKILDGYYRYLTNMDRPPYGSTAMIHSDGEITIIGHGVYPDAPVKKPVPPGFTQRTAPIMMTFNFMDHYEPGYVVQEIRQRNHKRIGIAGMSMISAGIYKALVEQLDVEIVECADIFDYAKAIKSEEEIQILREVSHIHDLMASALPHIVREGKTTRAMYAELYKLGVELGCEELNCNLRGLTFGPDEPMKYGDSIWCLIEVSGPSGFFGEFGRNLCLGDPSEELQEVFKIAKGAQLAVEQQLKPNAVPGELRLACNHYLESHGCAGEYRLMGHGQSTDMVERPALLPEETMLLQENMFLAVHPEAHKYGLSGFCCDNFLITPDGCERMLQIPREIMVIY